MARIRPGPPKLSLQMAALQNDRLSLRQWYEWSFQSWRAFERPSQRGRGSWAWDVGTDSCLRYAARAGDSATVQELLEFRIGKKLTNTEVESSLLIAAAAGHTETVNILLRYNSKPSTVAAALSQAASKEVVCTLIQHAMEGAVNRALIKAVQFDRPLTVSALLDAGACPNTKNRFRSPALTMAAAYGHFNCTVLLLKAGADINADTMFGLKALHCAAMSGSREVISELLDAGIDVNQQDKECYTPLFYAARGGVTSAASLLLEAGANVNARNSRAWTALHVAASEGKADMAFYLLKHGANPSARNRRGRAPWQLARDAELRDQLRIRHMYSRRRRC